MLGQPPLGSYLMGLGLTLQGRDLDTNGFYDFHFGQDWNWRHGNMPDEADLAAARRTNSVVGALIAVSVYLIARGLSNAVAGIAAAALLVPHPLSIYLSSLAGSDALVTLLVALAALVAMALANRPTWPRAILLGVLLGLGGSAKLSPLALAILLAAAGMVLVIHGWRGSGAGARHDGRLGWRLLVQPPLAAPRSLPRSPISGQIPLVAPESCSSSGPSRCTTRASSGATSMSMGRSTRWDGSGTGSATSTPLPGS